MIMLICKKCFGCLFPGLGVHGERGGRQSVGQLQEPEDPWQVHQHLQGGGMERFPKVLHSAHSSNTWPLLPGFMHMYLHF